MKNKILLLTFCLPFLLILACDKDNGDDGNGDTPTITLPKLSINNVTTFEGDSQTTFRFKVNANQVSDKLISVDYTTSEKSAGAGADYVEQSGTLEIPIGEQQVFIDVAIVTDTLKEGDETFEVILSNPINAELQTATGLGTIRNDDDFLFIPEDGYITPLAYPAHTLVWHDEFDGPNIDNNNWTHEFGGHGWGNNERQYYSDRSENSYISDGKLVIEAIDDGLEGSDYTSARMISKDKQEFEFGRIDIRAKLPKGQGIWPALWMLGANFGDVGWPACGEIDIMELIGSEPDKVHGTIHWGAQGQGFSHFQGNEYSLNNGGDFSDEFHVFTLIWELNEIKWYVDDNLFSTKTLADVSSTGSYPFNEDFFFILNVAVGGNWPGYPDATTVFPQRMLVDYIRVFQEN